MGFQWNCIFWAKSHKSYKEFQQFRNRKQYTNWQMKARWNLTHQLETFMTLEAKLCILMSSWLQYIASLFLRFSTHGKYSSLELLQTSDKTVLWTLVWEYLVFGTPWMYAHIWYIFSEKQHYFHWLLMRQGESPMAQTSTKDLFKL